MSDDGVGEAWILHALGGTEQRVIDHAIDGVHDELGGTGAEIVVGDMRDVSGFADAIDGVDAAAHTAAYFREYFAPGDHASALEDVNVKGTLALLVASDARGVRRFVQTSSSGAVGNPARPRYCSKVCGPCSRSFVLRRPRPSASSA